MNWKKRNHVGQPSSLPRMLLLALFFLAGVGLGQVLASRVPVAVGEELTEYLHHYVTVEEERSVQTLLSVLLLYLRYPLLAALLGFASIGVVLLPFVTTAFGLFLSFSACCFTATFGGDGVLLALAVFGLRCAITLPCYFLLAIPAWGSAGTLAAMSFGRGRRTISVVYGRAWWQRLGVCFLVLLAGVCMECLVSPWFLRLALGRCLA